MLQSEDKMTDVDRCNKMATTFEFSFLKKWKMYIVLCKEMILENSWDD